MCASCGFFGYSYCQDAGGYCISLTLRDVSRQWTGGTIASETTASVVPDCAIASTVILMRGHVFADLDNTTILGHKATFRSNCAIASNRTSAHIVKCRWNAGQAQVVLWQRFCVQSNTTRNSVTFRRCELASSRPWQVPSLPVGRSSAHPKVHTWMYDCINEHTCTRTRASIFPSLYDCINVHTCTRTRASIFPSCAMTCTLWV